MSQNAPFNMTKSFGPYLYAPIYCLGEEEFLLLYSVVEVVPGQNEFNNHPSFATTPEEAAQLGIASAEGHFPHLEGMTFSGRVMYLLDPGADRRYGFAPVPSPQDNRAMLILLSGPLFEASAGTPAPESGLAPVGVTTQQALILKGL